MTQFAHPDVDLILHFARSLRKLMKRHMDYIYKNSDRSHGHVRVQKDPQDNGTVHDTAKGDEY